MYHLDVIKSMNRKAPVVSESETSRHCSFVQSTAGTVLHSAKQRNTVFLKGAAAKRFLARVRVANSDARRDEIIESYFN